MMKKPILLIYVNFSSFVKADFEILSSFAMVTKYQFKPGKGIIATGIELIKELFFLVFKGYRYESIFIWFGDYHSLLPVLYAKVFGKKSYIVIGGYDVSTLEEYKYGSFSHPIRAFFTRMTFKYVDICFPVAEALYKKLLRINPHAKAEIIATYADIAKFNFNEYSRSSRIITVSGTSNQQRLMVKGLDRFREFATYLPEFEFLIIGVNDGVKKYFEPIPANLTLIPPQHFDNMVSYYQSASIYAQLSRSEGLPNALCEAMLCGCIPIGTDVGDVRIAIGETGLTVAEWNPESLAKFIRLNHNNRIRRDEARARILSIFNPKRRIERFNQIFGSSQ